MRSLRVLYLHNAGVLGAFNLLDLSFNLDLVYCTRCSPGVLILKIKYHTWLNLAALPIKSILLVYFWTVSTTAAVFFLIGPRKPCFEQFPYANLQFYQGPQTWTGRKHPRLRKPDLNFTSKQWELWPSDQAAVFSGEADRSTTKRPYFFFSSFHQLCCEICATFFPTGSNCQCWVVLYHLQASEGKHSAQTTQTVMHPIVQRRAVNFKSRVFFHTSTAFSHQLHYMPERPPYEVSPSN